MNKLVVNLITLSVFIPLVTGLIQIKKMDRAHYPFLLYLTLGFLNETLSIYLVRKGHSNAINGNIYLLLVGITLIYQFRQWRLFQASWLSYFLITLLLVGTWIIEVFVISTIKTFASFYILIYASATVLMSIRMINQVMAREKQSLLKNPVFMICAGFILFFTNSIIVEAAYIYSLNLSRDFQITIFRIMLMTLLFTNLIYTAAFLWMPKRRRFLFSF